MATIDLYGIPSSVRSVSSPSAKPSGTVIVPARTPQAGPSNAQVAATTPRAAAVPSGQVIRWESIAESIFPDRAAAAMKLGLNAVPLVAAYILHKSGFSQRFWDMRNKVLNVSAIEVAKKGKKARVPKKWYQKVLATAKTKGSSAVKYIRQSPSRLGGWAGAAVNLALFAPDIYSSLSDIVEDANAMARQTADSHITHEAIAAFSSLDFSKTQGTDVVITADQLAYLYLLVSPWAVERISGPLATQIPDLLEYAVSKDLQRVVIKSDDPTTLNALLTLVTADLDDAASQSAVFSLSYALLLLTRQFKLAQIGGIIAELFILDDSPDATWKDRASSAYGILQQKKTEAVDQPDDTVTESPEPAADAVANWLKSHK